MANVFIIMIPILLTTTLFMLKDVSDFLIKGLQQKADVSVYFNESVSQDDILKVRDKIKQMPNVAEVQYVSKEDALLAFRQRHQDDPVIMQSLDQVNGNPLYSSLSISALTPGQFEEVSALLAQDEYKDLVNTINYEEKKEVIDKIFSLTENARQSGLLLFAVVGAISVMVTFNTVRMAIFSRKREVGIQRLVGASRWFIRGQFLVEGAIFGILGAVFSMFLAAGICWYFNPGMAAVLPGMNLWQNFSTAFWTIFGIQMGIGVGLGVFSSVIAVSRYLKV